MIARVGRNVEDRRDRIERLRRALKLPHTVEQLARRFGVEQSTISRDLAPLRAGLIVNTDEDPPTYRLRNPSERHEPDIEVKCDCGAIWRGDLVAKGARNIAAHAKRAPRNGCHVHPPTARTDQRYRELHRDCDSVAHYVIDRIEE